jgi:putative ABC transport system substrate-binding protein
MRLIGLAIVLALTLLAPLVAEAQQAGRIYRVGVPWIPPREDVLPLIRVLEDGLRERGYGVGQNLVIDHRFADGQPERLPNLIADLVRLNVDVLVVGLNPVAIAARQATSTIPIVTTIATDPVNAGLVKSLARPGGNLTGLSADTGPELAGKILEFLKEILPTGPTRLAVLWNSSTTNYDPHWRALEEDARRSSVTLVRVPVQRADELEHAFEIMRREQARGALILADQLIFVHRHRINDLARYSRLPTIWTSREFVVAGGLLSYGPNVPDLYRRAATFVDKILKGAKPGDLPIEQPTKFELVINLKTAKALGLTIPPSVLGRADQVID